MRKSLQFSVIAIKTIKNYITNKVSNLSSIIFNPNVNMSILIPNSISIHNNINNDITLNCCLLVATSPKAITVYLFILLVVSDYQYCHNRLLPYPWESFSQTWEWFHPVLGES